MKIDYGPPGEAGVKSLQYVGDSADYTSMNIAEFAKPVGKVAVGVWLYAFITGNRSLKLVSLGVAAGSLFVQVTAPKK
jgi:hypothetical protein